MAERQYGKLREIRRDHLARYEWAKGVLPDSNLVIADIACGCGYGSYILASSNNTLISIDKSQEAIDYAKENYSKTNISYICGDAISDIAKVDVIVSFETLEHLVNDAELLSHFRRKADRLLISAPNEHKLPYRSERFPYHFKHYKRDEMERLLNDAGFTVSNWYGQENAYSDVVKGMNGRTLIADCV